MPAILPLDVDENILHYLTDRDLYRNSDEYRKTLQACTLVCRSWYPICNQRLFKELRIRSPQGLSMLKLAISKPLSFKSISTFTLVEHLDAHHSPGQSQFIHLVPFTLAKNLPNLRTLQIGMEGDTPNTKQRPYPFDRRALRCLDQFRNLEHLSLYNYYFQSFPSLRRFIGAFPKLSRIFLRQVSWDPKTQRSFPVWSTNLSLCNVVMTNCQSNLLAAWFWAPRRLQLSNVGGSIPSSPGPNSPPNLAHDEADLISKLLGHLYKLVDELTYSLRYSNSKEPGCE